MRILTPLKSIRAKCMDCSNGSRKRVTECIEEYCSLYIYRMGTNPHRKGMGNLSNFVKKNQ